MRWGERLLRMLRKIKVAEVGKAAFIDFSSR
jgi:hypothetical protein